MKRSKNNNNKMRANKPKRKNRQANFQDKDTVQTNRPVLKLTDDLRTKWHVSGRTSVNVTTTPYILDVAPLIVQGIGADNRIGDVIRFLRADVTLSWTYGDPSNVCRFMAFWNLGMPPVGWTAGDFLDSGPSGVPDVYSQAYPYYRNRRFLLLYDRTDVVNNSTAQQVTHQISFPINMNTTYVYSTNTVASGSLIFVAITDSSLAPNPLLILNPRFTYKDY